MLMDIFSHFDPFTMKLFSSSSTLFWIYTLAALLPLHSSFWMSPSRLSQILPLPLNVMLSQLQTTSGTQIKGLSAFLSSLFLFFITLNLSGMIPYMFSPTSHLILTLSLGLPMWLSLIISSLLNSPQQFAAALLPEGAPAWLNPFLVLVETLSTLVRPLTLSFRLAANMTAGHIIMTLIGAYLSSAMLTSFSATIFLLLTQTGYMIFEVAICFIQAYIFCLLLSLYSNDHTA